MIDRQIKHIAKIISLQLGWTNGWSTSDENYEKECLTAAVAIKKYLQKKDESSYIKYLQDRLHNWHIAFNGFDKWKERQ